MASEKSLKSVFRVRIEEASLTGNSRNAQTIHEAQKSALQPSEHGGSCTGTSLPAIFPKGDIASPMQALLDTPMPSDEQEQVVGRNVGRLPIPDPLDGLLTDFSGFEQRGGPRQAKDVRDACPRVGEPLSEFGVPSDVPMFEAAMSRVPRLGLRPLPSPRRVREKVREIGATRRLRLFGHQERPAAKALDGRTQLGGRRHGVKGARCVL